VVPNWHLQSWWVAYWNIFGHPTTPVRSGYVFDAWWIDKQLAATTNANRQNGD
jgi:microcin C transport system substrate-binding protein